MATRRSPLVNDPAPVLAPHTFYSGKHKRHGMNVQVLADPGGSAGVGLAGVARRAPRHGRCPRARPNRGLGSGGIHVVADTAYQGGGPAIRVPQRRRRLDPDTGRYRRLSRAQKEVNTAHARQRGPGERANAQLKAWKVLRQIRCCPSRATALVKAVTVLIQTG